jgi:hypothetical protein
LNFSNTAASVDPPVMTVVTGKTETGPPPAGDGPSGSRQSHLET